MEELTPLKNAKEYAKKAYEGKIRASGDTYYNHAERVVRLLKRQGILNEGALILAYLKDVVDFNWNPQEIEKIFGKKTVTSLEKYSKISGVLIRDMDPKKIDNSLIVKTFLNIAEDPNVLFVRLASKADNIQNPVGLTKEKALVSAERALILYAPMCKILGLYVFVRILEDNAFKIINPGEYYRIDKYIQNNLPEINKSLRETKIFVQEIFRERNIICEIDYRIKHIYSIYLKAQKKFKTDKQENLDLIKDIAAMRILTDNVEQCYEAEGLLKDLWDFMPEERDDYIAKPKSSGYKSIHNIFKLTDKINLEIQIKTKEMHEYNEYGQASHVIYKVGTDIKSLFKNDKNLLKDLNYKEIQAGSVFEKLNFKIYVFTPMADIIELPKGATILDFAYHVHRDLGNSCMGGVVNGEFHNSSFELTNGDLVQVKTLPQKKKPGHQWLNIVKTKKARDEIKKALRS